MAKVGVDDLIAVQGPEVIRDLIDQAWRFDGHPCPTPVHLSDIENASLGRQRLAIDLMVSSVGETYLLPKTLVLRCFPLLPKPQTKPKLRLVKEGEEPVVTEGDGRLKGQVDHLIEVPRVDEFLSPIVNVVPLQLLSYHVANLLGCDVDQPRNLAKSVTVE